MNICGLETGEGCPHFTGGVVASYFINGEIYSMRYVCDNEKICKYVIEKMKEKEGKNEYLR